MIRLTVHLDRDSFESPWGFRLQGGKDLNQPLTVQRVFTNSPAEGELQRGDVILLINGRDASSFTHKQALDQIKFGGGQIDLVVDRPPSGSIHIKPITHQSPTRAPSLPSPTKVPTLSPILFPSRAQPAGPPSPTKSTMPPPQGAGFSPKKVTLNKLGGGDLNFGTDFVHGYKPQVVVLPASTPATMSRGYDSPDYASRSAAPDIEYDEDDYPTSPVRVRQKLFSEEKSKAARSSGKKVVLSTPNQPVPAFGFDYTKPRPYQPAMKPQPPSPAPKPASKKPEPYAPPVKSAVQAILQDEQKQSRGQDKPDAGPAWGSTLKTEKRELKPWEKEQLQQEEFNKKQARGFQPDFDENDASPSYQSPRQNIIQIKTQSTARQQSASQPQQQQQQQQQQKQQTYQPQQQAPVQSSASTKPAVPGERDWNQSYVYKMLHEETKTERQVYPGSKQEPTRHTEVKTRDTYETQRPGEEPRRTVKETFSTSSLPPRLDDALGMSDF
ncbi:hypothetical protein ACJMK2_034452 [Sinanodonta woodiana]|uniref:PDZ domain-containing protein n=2 Tax=Sinanodonta woodiana TaxID=1069815 RepID=A0ABD3WRN2_SINWO